MGYSLVLQLKQEAPIQNILELLQSNVVSEQVNFSIDPEYNESNIDYKNAIFISYGAFGGYERNLMDFMLYRIAYQYGVHQKNFLDKKYYPCYYYDDMLTFLLTKDQDDSVQSKYPDEYMCGFSIITEDDKERLINDAELNEMEENDEYYKKVKTFLFKSNTIPQSLPKEWMDEFFNAQLKAEELISYTDSL